MGVNESCVYRVADHQNKGTCPHGSGTSDHSGRNQTLHFNMNLLYEYSIVSYTYIIQNEKKDGYNYRHSNGRTHVAVFQQRVYRRCSIYGMQEYFQKCAK